jgi:hypothetical protein
VTAANVADIAKTAELLHGEERQMHRNADTSACKRLLVAALGRSIEWKIACNAGLIQAMAEGAQPAAEPKRMD